MNIVQFKECLHYGYESGKPILALSSPGIGKSSAVFQFVEELSSKLGESVDLIEVRGSTLNPMEMADVKYIKDGKVCDAPQDWVPTDEKVEAGECSRVSVIFLDELFDVSVPTTQSVLQRLFLDRKLGSAELAKGCYVCAASNEVKHRAAATRPSTALINRVIVVKVEADPDVLFNYLIRKDDFHRAVPAFLRFRPDCIQPPDFKEMGEDLQFCSPRSLEAAGKLLYKLPPDVDDDLKLELLNGTVGTGVGVELFGFEKMMNDLPDLDKVIEDPDNYPVPKPIDVAIATVYALFNRIKDDETLERVARYLVRYPTEMSVMAIKDLRQIHANLFQVDCVREWAVDKSFLFI